MSKKSATQLSTSSSGENSSNDLDINAYNDIVQNARLVDLRMIKCKFDVMPEYYAAQKVGDMADDQADVLEFTYKCEPTVEIFEGEAFSFLGQFVWSVRVRLKKKVVLSLRATYHCLFYSPIRQDDKVVDFFVIRVGRNATYPFFRSWVNAISGDSKASLPLLPMLTQGPVN